MLQKILVIRAADIIQCDCNAYRVVRKRQLDDVSRAGKAFANGAAEDASKNNWDTQASDSSTVEADKEYSVEGNEETQVETWVEWIQRATGKAVHEARKANVADWVEEQRKRKWRWAGHVIRRADGRWSKEVCCGHQLLGTGMWDAPRNDGRIA